MTGPEHFGQAQTHLELAARAAFGPDKDTELRTAQVHALLALTAAVALNEAVSGMPETDRDDWQNTVGTPRGGAR